MSSLKIHEKVVFERLLDRGGYVLDFTDKTFAEFFREHHINIEEQKYRFNGDSKMKRLRAFWEIEPDPVVGRILEALIQYAREVSEVVEDEQSKALKIIDRLIGRKTSHIKSGAENNESDFLKREFGDINLNSLDLDVQIEPVIRQRIDEIRKAISAKIALATVFLCGSTLEGLLQDIAVKKARIFNEAKAAPKDSNGKVQPFQKWTLQSLIDVAYEVEVISLDVKKHSHALKDFRNYIHPREQSANRFNPDIHTAQISWQVLRAAIANLSGDRKL